MTTYEQRASRMGDEVLERFYELAGFHLSDGVRPDLADQRAWLVIAAAQRARKGEVC